MYPKRKYVIIFEIFEQLLRNVKYKQFVITVE